MSELPQNAFAGSMTLLQAGMCHDCVVSQDVGKIAGVFSNVSQVSSLSSCIIECESALPCLTDVGLAGLTYGLSCGGSL